MKRTFHKGQILTLQIQDMAFGGKGIARLETEKGPFVVFVQNAFPGQTVEAQVVKCKSKHAECRLLKVLEKADFELELPHQAIPGAPYATVPIERQHEWKTATALDLYRKIGGVENLDDVFQGLVPSPETWHYRNKMEYSFSEIRHDLETDEKVDDFGLGFKHRGTWWAVENLDADSGLFDPLVESTLHRSSDVVRSHGVAGLASTPAQRLLPVPCGPQEPGRRRPPRQPRDHVRRPLGRGRFCGTSFAACGATVCKAFCTPSTTTSASAWKPAKDNPKSFGATAR